MIDVVSLRMRRRRIEWNTEEKGGTEGYRRRAWLMNINSAQHFTYNPTEISINSRCQPLSHRFLSSNEKIIQDFCKPLYLKSVKFKYTIITDIIITVVLYSAPLRQFAQERKMWLCKFIDISRLGTIHSTVTWIANGLSLYSCYWVVGHLSV